MGSQNCPAGLLFFSCWLTSLFLKETILHLLFSSWDLLQYFLYPQIMPSHFTDKIEKSFSLHQTCNLHWGPFSPSLVWLKWKSILQPVKVQSLLHVPWISSPHILSLLHSVVLSLDINSFSFSLTGWASPIYTLLSPAFFKNKSLYWSHISFHVPPHFLTSCPNSDK